MKIKEIPQLDPITVDENSLIPVYSESDGTGKTSLIAFKNAIQLSSVVQEETESRQIANNRLSSRITTIEDAFPSEATSQNQLADKGYVTTEIAALNSTIGIINGNDAGKSMREVAQEVSATVYTPQGSCLFANLPSLSASSTKVGFVYDITDSFTTTSEFKEGAGIEVPAGTNIVVADVNGTKMWDLLGFNIDLSPYQKKIMSAPISVGGSPQSTVEGAIGALASLPAEAVFHVSALPTGNQIENVIYHNTTDGKYYVGNKTTQTTSELNTDSVQYVDSLPESPNIENFIYAVEALSGKYKFYAGDKDNQTLQELGGAGSEFIGTWAKWNALSLAQKAEYTIVNIPDVLGEGGAIVVDEVANGNMNAVSSNAVYNALPTFEQYVFPLTYTVAAGAVVEIETTIAWSNDIIVIPRWLGTTEVMLVNYYNSNNKVKIGLRNISSSTVTISALDSYLSVIRSKVNWS